MPEPLATALVVLFMLGLCVTLDPIPALYLYVRLRHGKDEAAEFMYRNGKWDRPDGVEPPRC